MQSPHAAKVSLTDLNFWAIVPTTELWKIQGIMKIMTLLLQFVKSSPFLTSNSKQDVKELLVNYFKIPEVAFDKTN